MATSRFRAEVQYDAKMGRLLGEIRRASRAQEASIRGVTRAVREQATGWRGASVALQGFASAVSIANSAASSLVTFLQATAGAAARQRTGILQLDRSLRNTLGRTYDDLRDRIETLTSAQQRNTRFGDDETRLVMARVADALAGTNVSYGDVERATKALQDAMVASNRGVQELTESFSSQIRQGRSLSDVLSEMESRYQGAAAAISEADLAVARARNTWGDLLEAIGDVATDVGVTTVNALSDASEGLNRLDEFVLVLTADTFELGNAWENVPVLLTDAARAAQFVTAELERAQTEVLDFAAEFLAAQRASSAQVAEFLEVREIINETLAEGGLRPGGGRITTPREPRRGGGERRRQVGRLGAGRGRGVTEGARGIADFIAEQAEQIQAEQELLTEALIAQKEAQIRINQDLQDDQEAKHQRRLAQIQEEIAAEQALVQAQVGGTFAVIRAAGEKTAGIIKAEKGFAVWRAALAAAEAIWRAAFGDLAGAAQASAAAAAFSAAVNLVGTLVQTATSAGGGGGAPGRGRTAGTTAPPSGLVGAPLSPGGPPVNINVTFEQPYFAQERTDREFANIVDRVRRRGLLD